MKFTLHYIFSNAYGRLGGLIAKRPLYFLLVPLLLSLSLAVGILNVSYRRDLFNLFTPSEGRSTKDLKVMEDLFEKNVSSEYDLSRLIKERMYVTVTVSTLDGNTILRREIFKEIRQVDEVVRNTTIVHQGKHLNYSQICATNFGECAANVGLLTDKEIDSFYTGEFTMKYPVEINPITYKVIPYAQNFGGVTTDEDGYIQEALAYRFFYPPDQGRNDMIEAMTEWEQKTLKRLESLHFNHIKVSMGASSDKEMYSRQFTENVLHLSGISAATIVLFCGLVCMTSNWVSSKPWLGVSACVSAALASIAAFGLVMICGVSYIDMNVALPFLMLGMGIDDSFVLLSAWRRTNVMNSVEQRLKTTYSDTAASITITSLTNFISFAIGLTAPFPVIRIFCVYAATGVMFTLCYQLTFYGACLALTGRREAKGLHPFTFRKIQGTTTQCEGDVRTHESMLSPNVKVMETFGTSVGRYLIKWPTKILVAILYCNILVFGIWGLGNIEEGLDMRDTLPSASMGIQMLNDHYKYYSQYAHRIHVAITGPMDYATSETQERIERTLKKFEANPLIADTSLTESWLRAFKMFADSDVSKFSLGAFNISEKQDFIDALRVFLRFPQTRNFNKDVVFNENYTDIVASRFFVLCNEASNKEEEKDLLETVWSITDESDIPITVYSYWFTFYEQLTLIKPVAIQTLCIAAAVIITIFFAFIPDLPCCLLVAATVLTIQIEVVGIMALWGVSLDIFSLMNLIMCVGFSINYPAHLAFAYVTTDVKTADDRLKAALYAVGFPIIQGSFSTILEVSVLALDPSYMFSVFFKIIFLEVLLTAVHSIFVLPVALNAADRFLCFTLKAKETDVYIPVSNIQEA